MRVGDRFDLPCDGIHGGITHLWADEQTGDVISIVVAMDDGRFAAVDLSLLPVDSDWLQ